MKISKEQLKKIIKEELEKNPKYFYHVTNFQWRGEDITNPVERYGEKEAMRRFQKRWRDAGDLVFSHVYCVHLYDSLQDAKNHIIDFGGVDILQIDAEGLKEKERVWVDDAEFFHYVTQKVPSEVIIGKIKELP